MSKTHYSAFIALFWLVATASGATLLVPSVEYPNLQDALAAASSGDEIWVAEGIYRPDQGAGQEPGNREATFQLKNGAALYGGFPTGGQWQSRDPNVYTTVLSGDLAGDDEPGFVNNAENSYHVVTGSGTDESAILDGFIITAGHGQGGQTYLRYGAGMYNVDTACVISNCVFSYNLSNEGAGGGMYNENSSPTLVNCSFIGNSGGENGIGGMYNAVSNPVLTGCVFTGNYGYTGAMINHESSPTLTDCMFNENSVTGGSGAVHNREGSCPQFFNCVFTRNTSATGSGGAMKNGNNSSPTLTNCTFSENSARRGAGMYNFGYSSPLLYNCAFIDNQCSGTSFCKGAAMFNSSCSPVITNCLFIANFSEGDGAAMYNQNGSATVPSAPQLINCTVTGNESADEGGGLYNRPGTLPTLTNCILWNNTDAGGADESAQIHDGNPTVNYSCVLGWTGSLGGTGNIGEDPLLAPDGYHLMEDSPCINAGDPAGDYSAQVDIDHEPRVMNGRVDIGADELKGPQLLALEIAGPDEVAEHSQAQYQALAYFDNDSIVDVTDSANWSVEPNDIADIAGGLLKTEMVDLPEDITITAQYSEGDVNEIAEKDVSIFAICPSGSALEFDGVDDYVDMVDGFGDFTNGFTVLFWAYPTNTGNWWPKFIDFGNGPGSDNIILARFERSNTLAFVVWSGSSEGSYVLAEETIQLNKWQHFGATLDSSGNAVIYKNGVEVASGTTHVPRNLTRVNNYVGRSNWNDAWYQGRMDELMVSNRTLSAEEIRMLMYTRSDTDEPNLVGYWNFDEGEGDIAHDSSGFGNDGTVVGAIWTDSIPPVGDICTLDALVQRNLNDILTRKLAIIDELAALLDKEAALLDYMDQAFHAGQFDNLKKGDVVKAKEKIHSAIQHEQQAQDMVGQSINKLDHAMSTLGIE